MEKKDISCDIILSGGGPAGSTLALLLANAGLDVVLIDPEPQSPPNTVRPTGRTAALFNGSINILKASGLWDDLQDQATPLRIMRIVDARDNKAGVTFHAGDIGLDEFGFNIPNKFLKDTAHAQIRNNKNIKLLNPDKLKTYSIDGGHVCAETDTGLKISASLVIGTDGRNSTVRKVAGIDVRTDSYDQTAITCLITHTKPHNFQSTEFHRAGGPFTLVPMPGNQSSIVWVEKTEDAQKFLAMKKQEFEQAVQDRTQGLVGTISLESTPESWPLMFLNANKLTATRAAIAAEAAHVISPLGAQGLNLSLRDVAALAETIIDAARLGEDIGSDLVLSRYEKRRHADIGTRVNGMDAYNRLVAHELSFLQDIRRLGIKGLEQIAPLKNLAMSHGLAPMIDDGRLIRGQGL